MIQFYLTNLKRKNKLIRKLLRHLKHIRTVNKQILFYQMVETSIMSGLLLFNSVILIYRALLIFLPRMLCSNSINILTNYSQDSTVAKKDTVAVVPHLSCN